MCAYICTLGQCVLLLYVYLLNDWLFGAIKSIIKWGGGLMIFKLSLHNCVDFYK